MRVNIRLLEKGPRPGISACAASQPNHPHERLAPATMSTRPEPPSHAQLQGADIPDSLAMLEGCQVVEIDPHRQQ